MTKNKLVVLSDMYDAPLLNRNYIEFERLNERQTTFRQPWTYLQKINHYVINTLIRRSSTICIIPYDTYIILKPKSILDEGTFRIKIIFVMKYID